MLTRLITALQLRFGLHARRLPLAPRPAPRTLIGIERRDDIDYVAVRPAGRRVGDPLHFRVVNTCH